MKDIKKLWDRVLNAEKQAQPDQPRQAKEQEQQPEKTEAMQKLIKTTKDFVQATQPDVEQLNFDISDSSEELTQIKELAPDEYTAFRDVYKEAQALYNKVSKFAKYLENYQIYRRVQEFLSTAKTGQYKFFDELDIYLTTDRAFDVQTALDVLDFSKERYEYEFNENPVKLLAEIKYQEDNKIQSEISTLKTSISLPSDLIDELQSEYDFDINNEQDITKLTHILMQRIKDHIPQALRPDVVNDLLNSEQIIVNQISTSVKIATVTQGSSDLILQVIRGFDKKVEQLTKERAELSGDVLKKHEEISNLEKQTTQLKTKINELERKKMELEDSIKELKIQSSRATAESSLTFAEPNIEQPPQQPELSNEGDTAPDNAEQGEGEDLPDEDTSEGDDYNDKEG